MRFTNVSNKELEDGLLHLVQSETQTIADMIEHIAEAERRRLYASRGYVSLFEYLTKFFKLSNGSAQRRIDAARLLNEIPEIQAEIQKNDLNLMKLSALAFQVREKQRITRSKVSTSVKREILQAIDGKDMASTQVTISQMLDIPVKTLEKKRVQQDESLRVEMTFSKEEQETLNELKSSLSHIYPNASVKDILLHLGKEH